MKPLLRVFVFTLISVKIMQYLIGTLNFPRGDTRTFILVVVGLALLNSFLKTILSIISFPTKGFSYMFLSFIMTLIMLYILTLFLHSFYVKAMSLENLIILGFVLPSWQIKGFWAYVLTAAVLSVVYKFFDWLCSKK